MQLPAPYFYTEEEKARRKQEKSAALTKARKDSLAASKEARDEMKRVKMESQQRQKKKRDKEKAERQSKVKKTKTGVERPDQGPHWGRTQPLIKSYLQQLLHFLSK